MATFPTTKRHLSTLHPCPFEAPSLTFRTSIPKPPQPETCPTPAPPLAYGLSTRPISPPPPKNRAFPPSVSPKIPTPHFHQRFLPSALRPHRQDDHAECNGVGEEWPCAILRNPKWHETACSRRQAPPDRWASVTCASKLAPSPRQPINLRRNENFVGQSLFFSK